MKKWLLVLFGIVGLLNGCSNKQNTTAASAIDSSTAASKITLETSTSSKTSRRNVSEARQTRETSSTIDHKSTTEQTLWNADKSAQLSSFMVSWGQTMQQQYKRYNRNVPLNLYGLVLPQTLLNGEWHFLVNDLSQTLEWSNSGIGTADFQLVAIYSDIENTHTMSSHTYFFGFENKQPIVLITQQNQGSDTNELHFKETSNQTLMLGFKQIVTN
ncbi:DUF4767 domain-containing protein [Enterococcus mundtii]|uniref:DUF4767 domain-containing protein n=1 Tax=Enterococcus mundtii TaxID=53346 RepID=A0A242KW31_ENTMU|nr:DUF4767 domain-containing protein [Enterococcus mundtii]NBA60811.1 DUF4767 domain-containing protein [Enterococcus mundtii]OTP25444.1 hypothetical protein A5802_002597 [Enterococcus mundtii]